MLVAETITRRFFNVIQLLSLSIPIIAIQVNAIDGNGKKLLHFKKMLDLYEEPDDEVVASDSVYNRTWWLNNAPWNVSNAESFQRTIAPVLNDLDLNYVKNYVALSRDTSNYFTFRKRSSEKSLLKFWISTSNLEAVKALLDKNGIPYNVSPYHTDGQMIQLTLDQKLIEASSEMFQKLAELVKSSWV